jgi:hypothetical protein
MFSAITILVFSAALGFFYLETVCEKILRREFSQPYFETLVGTIHLEFPHRCNPLSGNTAVDFSKVRSALKSDFAVLTFLAQNGNPQSRHFSVREKVILAYFKLLFQTLPVCHACRIREEQTVARLETVLYYLANLVGERVAATNGDAIFAIE